MKTGLCVFVKSKPVTGLEDFLKKKGFEEYRKPSPSVSIFIVISNSLLDDDKKFNSIKNEVETIFPVVVDRYFSDPIYIPPLPDTGEPLSLL